MREPRATEHRAAGRRSSGGPRRAVGLAAVLAVAMPVVTIGAALLLRPDSANPTDRRPTTTSLDASSLICPGAEGSADVGVSSLAAPGASGEVSATTGADVTSLPVAPGTVAPATDQDAATVLAATGALAPALLGTRSVASPLSGVRCSPTSTDQWFTGVGAAAEHTSVLELVNPDAGRAVADVTVYSGTGVVDVPALRGVAVEPGSTTRLALSEVVPRRGELSLHVEVTRGRLGVAVLDRDDPLGGAAVATDWLPPQRAPAVSLVLLGLTRGTGGRDLTVANPGDDQVEVRLEIVSPRATFAPEGLAPISVPPQSSTTVPLDTLLTDASSRGAVGLPVQSSGPVTAALRQRTGDLSLLAPADAFTEPTAMVLPVGRARVLLTAGSTGGAAGATVVATDAAGTSLASTQVDLPAGTAENVRLPPGTALVTVTPAGPPLRGVVLVQKPGATVLPLTELQRTLRVPDVRPGLP